MWLDPWCRPPSSHAVSSMIRSGSPVMLSLLCCSPPEYRYRVWGLRASAAPTPAWQDYPMPLWQVFGVTGTRSLASRGGMRLVLYAVVWERSVTVTASAPYRPRWPVGCTMATRSPRTSHESLRWPRLIVSSLSFGRTWLISTSGSLRRSRTDPRNLPRAGPRTNPRNLPPESRHPAPGPLPFGAHTPD